MIFSSDNFYVDLIAKADINKVLAIYNSNQQFLLKHMSKPSVTADWLANELEEMENSGFCSGKIVEADTGNIIGIIDFKTGDETYLSLLMMSIAYKGQGFGRQVYQAFERYAIALGSKSIRIDVVADYDNSVLDFWHSNGFIKISDIELNWTGKILPAVVMRKSL